MSIPPPTGQPPARRHRWPRVVRCLLLAATLQIALVAPARGDAGVYTFQGAYFYNRTDLSMRAGSTGIAFRRTYRSAGMPSSPLGPGWTHNFAMRVRGAFPDSQQVDLVGPEGQIDRYTRQPDGTFTSRPGAPVALKRGSDGAYTASQERGPTWTFDRFGNLTEVEEWGGTRLLVARGAEGVESVRAPDSQAKLLFDYDPRTRRLLLVSEVPDPALGEAAVRSVRYGYDDAGRLTEVTDREGQVTRFAYHGDGSLLASITDARGHVAATITYDDEGRVAARTDARGLQTGQWNLMQYTRLPDGSRVTREEKVSSGWAPTWQPVLTSTHDSSARLVRHETLAGPDDTPEVVTFTYNGQVVAGSTRTGGATPVPTGQPEPGLAMPRVGTNVEVGDATSPLPEPRCLAAPPPPSGPWAMSTGAGATGQADPRWAALQDLAEAARMGAAYTRDAYGRLAGLVVADTGDGVPPENRTWRLEYDREDRLVKVESPPPAPDASPRATELRYDVVGNVVAVVDADGQVAEFTYDERDALIEARWPTGATAQYAYDNRGDLAQAIFSPGDGTGEQAAEYAFDALHRPRWVVRYPAWQDPAGAERTAFAYDEAGQCTIYRAA